MAGLLSRWRIWRTARNARAWTKWRVDLSTCLRNLPMPLPPGRIQNLPEEERDAMTITLYAPGRVVAFGARGVAEPVVREWKNVSDLNTYDAGRLLHFTDEHGKPVKLYPGGGSVVVEE